MSEAVKQKVFQAFLHHQTYREEVQVRFYP